MPTRHPQRRPRYSVPVVESPAPITPGSAVSITLKQAAVAVVVILGAGGAYASIVWTQSNQGADIATIKAAVGKVPETTAAISKDQDDKRAKLGEALVSSNKEIATKVGDLATAIAVQQANAAATKDALVKIGDQLNTLVHQLPEKRR